MQMMAILSAVALVGCDKRTDTRVYETRITALESNVMELYQADVNRQQDFIETLHLFETFNAVNSNVLAVAVSQGDQLEIQLEMIYNLDKRMTNFVSAFNRTIVKPPSRVQATGPKALPASVEAEIRSKAEREYPSDYSMQTYIVKWQTEAWHKMNP